MTDSHSQTGLAYPRPAYAWYVLGVIILGYIFAFVDRTIVGLIAPAIQADFGISDTEMGLLQGLAFAVFYTLFGLPLGWAIDRFNRKWLLSAGMVVWSGMTALCGAAGNFTQLFTLRIGVGIGEATLNPSASSLIADYFAPAKRPRAFAFYTMSTAFASILVALVGGAVLKALEGVDVVHMPLFGDLKPWQATFVIVGLPGLVPAFLFAFTVKEPKRLGQAAMIKGRATAAETRKFIMDNRIALGAMLLAGALTILEIYGAAYWHPSLFVRVYEWTPADFAFYVAMPQGFCGVIGAYTSANLTNYFKRKGHPEGVWFTMMIGVIGCTVFGGIAPLMPEAAYAIPLLYLKSLCVNFPPAAAMTAINEVTPNEHRGFVTALYVVLTGLVAQGLGPFSVGFTTDNVFADPQAIGQSLALVVFVSGAIGAALLLYSRRAYRGAVVNVSWEPAAKL